MVTWWFCFPELNSGSDVAPAVSQFRRSLPATVWVLELLKADALELERTGRNLRKLLLLLQLSRQSHDRRALETMKQETESATSVRCVCEPLSLGVQGWSIRQVWSHRKANQVCVCMCVLMAVCVVYIFEVEQSDSCVSRQPVRVITVTLQDIDKWLEASFWRSHHWITPQPK